MNSADTPRALELALEIEGLLMLLNERADMPDAPLSEINAMLSAKAAALAGMLCPVSAPAPAEETENVAASVEFEEESDAEPEPEPELEPESAPEPEPDVEPLPSNPSPFSAISSPSFEPLPSEAPANGKELKSIRSYLALNDMFRFRRELFAGSDARMNDALDMIDAMFSLPEAEEYFYGDLGWDREQPEVAEFMNIVSRRF